MHCVVCVRARVCVCVFMGVEVPTESAAMQPVIDELQKLISLAGAIVCT